MQLSEAARALDAEHLGDEAMFCGASIDTRTLTRGNLFVALEGRHVDGHQFLAGAEDAGAAGALVSHRLDSRLPLLLVDDTRRALGTLAQQWRRRQDVALVAVTGSNGKTTVKEMLTAIVAQQAPVLSTRGNLNNDIGVPLTLLRLDPEHRFAIVEMGANHPGEIDYLSRMAEPEVALITNAAPAHLEGFGDVEGVARAKGEIFAGVRAGGSVVLNADDPMYPLWRERAKHLRQVTFGFEHSTADVSGHWEPSEHGARVDLRTPAGPATVELPLPGRHNVVNALAATAVAHALGIELDSVCAGLAALHGVPGRLQWRDGQHGMRVLDDTYNANPGSLEAALELLVSTSGHKWFVLGDMGELGSAGVQLHAQAGRLARSAGVERLYAVGDLSGHAAAAFGSQGFHFDDGAALADALLADWQGAGTVLVKGSRAMRLEQVVERLCAGARAASAEGQ